MMYVIKHSKKIYLFIFIFFSSPHLVEVRERIRINGRPLDKELFAKYFFQCYERLILTLVNILSFDKVVILFLFGYFSGL